METGEKIQYVLSIISVVISGISLLITIIFNCINQYKIIKDN